MPLTKLNDEDLIQIREAVAETLAETESETEIFDDIAVRLAGEWLNCLRSNFSSGLRDRFVIAQAHLIWAYKGRVVLKDACSDEDYFSAERHLAALAAIPLLRSECPFSCVDESLPPAPESGEQLSALAQLLGGISLHRVAQIAAYLDYQVRKRQRKPGTEQGDFIQAIGALTRSVPGTASLGLCQRSACARQLASLLRCAWGTSGPFDLPRIVSSKISCMKAENQWTPNREGMVREYVTHFYGWAGSEFRSMDTPSTSQLLHCMRNEQALVSVLEAATQCLLLQQMPGTVKCTTNGFKVLSA